MQTIFARQLRAPAGWLQNVRVIIEDGRINRIEAENPLQEGDTRVDTLLPAPSNLHSHAFQRAMAGMTEFRTGGRDTFWTWRDLMYRFARLLTPEQYEAIAALAYMEMLEAGYAAVGEFHYMHHQPDGAPYDDISELSQRVFAAARQTGIGLTHLPVLYTYGGAGRTDLHDGQRRFANDVDTYARLVTRTREVAVANMPKDTCTGITPHSLRATCPEDLARAVALQEGTPIHIHIAEQLEEVEQITAWLSARPVEWLLENAAVDAHWCLVHATHMTKTETRGLARSGAVAGLCPITEANLGDGIFKGSEFVSAGGAFGIGSDSNIRIALGEELRMLEYSQRLRDQSRNVMIPGEGSLGATLFLGAAHGGARALGRDGGRVEVGALADLVAIDGDHQTLLALEGDQILDGLCFAAPDCVVTDVWSAGRYLVQNGTHIHRPAIVAAYRKHMAVLLEHL